MKDKTIANDRLRDRIKFKEDGYYYIVELDLPYEECKPYYMPGRIVESTFPNNDWSNAQRQVGLEVTSRNLSAFERI